MYEGNNEIKGIELLFEQGIITQSEYEGIRERIITKSVESKDDLLFEDIFKSYMSHLEKTVIKQTQAAYRGKIINFELYMHDVQTEELLFNEKFEKFNLQNAKDYFNFMQENNESLSYLNNTKSAIKNYCDYLNTIGINAPDLSSIKVDNRYYNVRIRHAYHIDEIYKIASFGNLRDNVLIRLAFEGGLKREQIKNIKVQDFDFDKNNMMVYDAETGVLSRVANLTNETAKLTKVYINELYENIAKWNLGRIERKREVREDFGFIFQNIKTATPQYSVIQTTLKKVSTKYFKSLGFDGQELAERVSDFTTESIKNSKRVYLFHKGLSTSAIMAELDDKNYALCNKSRRLVPLIYSETEMNKDLK